MNATMQTYPDKAAWVEAHRTGIGGRGALSALGLDPFRSPLLYYAQLRGLAPETEPGAGVRWGLALEAPVIQWYETETGRKVERLPEWSLLRHPDLPFVIGTPDGFVDGAGTDLGRGVYEGKVTGISHRDEWETEPPRGALVQVQHYLSITGYTWASVAGLILGRPVEGRYHDIPRHEVFITAMLSQLEAFWRRVHDRNPPPADSAESTRDALRMLFPRETVEAIDLPEEAGEIAVAYKAASAAEKDAKDTKAEASNKLALIMGDAAEGRLPDGTRITYKTVSRAAYSVEPHSGRELRIYPPKKGKGK